MQNSINFLPSIFVQLEMLPNISVCDKNCKTVIYNNKKFIAIINEKKGFYEIEFPVKNSNKITCLSDESALLTILTYINPLISKLEEMYAELSKAQKLLHQTV